ncbi:hypothetical protein [Nostoc sp. FACHB-888]|uniref:hypothetical protein n=1 Tax=Nostoc sp. FACHB-888 TaxID=2692842 RepID=UPI00168749D9|nr:hypothetical protein [Nostoc sp. FACHB-888]MBD2246603.1 hypothetical protein [Nostoc sp. FACHB-888]
MLNFSKVLALALTSLSFYTASIPTFLKPALAGEPIIDRNCHRHERTQAVFQKIPPQNQARILLTSPFKVNNQKYALQLLKFPNSTGVLCLWKPNDRLPQRLKSLSMIQDKVIEKVERDASHPGTYIVTVRGEKAEDILTRAYRLNLTNPNQPKATLLVRVYKK